MNKYEFNSADELIGLANHNNLKISDVVIEYSMIAEEQSRGELLKEMERRYGIMKQSIEGGLQIDSRSKSGMSGGDAKKLNEFNTNDSLLGDTLLNAVKYAFAIQEYNARFGRIVAFPTAGSAGTVPAVLVAAEKAINLSEAEVSKVMFTAAGIGMITGENAMLAGAMGGCQAEVGTASAMAAGALTELRGGTPEQVFNAASIALKGMLGLVCDPIGGLVEAPCVKRNATAVSNAYMASEVVMAGVESNVPYDQVIVAMCNIARRMPCEFKETAKGGLAITPVGKRVGRKVGIKSSPCSKCALCT